MIGLAVDDLGGGGKSNASKADGGGFADVTDNVTDDAVGTDDAVTIDGDVLEFDDLEVGALGGRSNASKAEGTVFCFDDLGGGGKSKASKAEGAD